MGYNLFNGNAQKFIYYSMALQKCADVVDMAQYVFIQGTDESFSIAKDLLHSLKSTETRKELFPSAGENTRTSCFEMRRIGDGAEDMGRKIFQDMGRMKSNKWPLRNRFARSLRSGDGCRFVARTPSDDARHRTDRFDVQNEIGNVLWGQKN